MRGWRRYLPFAPSVLIGAAAALWIAIGRLDLAAMLAPDRTVGVVAAATVATVGGVLGAAWLLERALPSFRHAGDLMERLLVRLDVPPGGALAVAVLTAGAEELMFRGALLETLGVWPQAVLFGLMHPATRQGWSYPVFAFAAALAFAWLALYTGTLWAPFAAHFAINLQGLLEARRRGARRRRTPPSAR